MAGYCWVGQVALGALLVSALSGCAPVMERDRTATSDAEEAPGRMLAKGSTVADNWLQIQREGSQASKTPQRLSVQERELANQRWLDSFTHPIPDFFDREAGGSFSAD